MKTKDFFFELPPERIAQFPPQNRGESRLMVLERAEGRFSHHAVADLPGLVESCSLFVFNNSRVRKARIYGIDRENGKKLEFLLLAPCDQAAMRWQALTKQRAARRGRSFEFDDGCSAQVAGWEDGVCLLEFTRCIDDTWLDRYGHVPLPPYIKRDDEAKDADRYQTVYAQETGSAAAPTAGLHFTYSLLNQLVACNIQTAFITLHTGLGTFLPVYSENIEDHKMHKEYYHIDTTTAEKIENAKHSGQKIIAVGTTTLRALESAWGKDGLKRGESATSIFIYGDYQFKSADMLFTNFHTPESTLLMLVSSFAGVFSDAEAGRKLILNAYNAALKEGYRFFSYGDAMLIR